MFGVGGLIGPFIIGYFGEYGMFWIGILILIWFPAYFYLPTSEHLEFPEL